MRSATKSRLIRLQLAGWILAVLGLTAAQPGAAVELSAPVAALYSTVSIYPPSATSMTVCYGFVCRRREILDFTPADRKALAQILGAGKASAAAERAAVQKAVVWFDRRMGPVLGTDKRVAKADFRYFDDKHNYDCWDTTRNTTSLLLVLQEWGLLKYHSVGDPHYRGNALVLIQGQWKRDFDFWLLDIATGSLRRLTNLRPGFDTQSFDVSPDGKQILFDRYRLNSDVVLIDLPPR